MFDALALDDLETAESRLPDALDRARRSGFLQEEIQAAVAWTEVQRRRGRLSAAAESLDGIAEGVAAGPFQLEASDAAAARARVERDAGRRDGAVAAARRAYELAWCDGPSACYQAGLQAAARLLEELGAEPPPVSSSDPISAADGSPPL